MSEGQVNRVVVGAPQIVHAETHHFGGCSLSEINVYQISKIHFEAKKVTERDQRQRWIEEAQQLPRVERTQVMNVCSCRHFILF